VDSVRITSKGQVTIPQQIRERLGLFRNTQVEFELDCTISCDWDHSISSIGTT
jgi:AbrB family looped-hinge helix DNA binding protein